VYFTANHLVYEIIYIMNKTQFRKTKVKTKKRRTGGAKTQTTTTKSQSSSAMRSAPYSMSKTKPSTLNNKNKKEQRCKYDPFCYQTNPHHMSQYTHTPLEKIDVEDVISKLINEKHNGGTTLYDAVIKWSHAKLESKKLTPSQLERLKHLHTRIQEEAFPNMRTLGYILR